MTMVKITTLGVTRTPTLIILQVLFFGSNLVLCEVRLKHMPALTASEPGCSCLQFDVIEALYAVRGPDSERGGLQTVGRVPQIYNHFFFVGSYYSGFLGFVVNVWSAWKLLLDTISRFEHPMT
jgi:hypothetical protein